MEVVLPSTSTSNNNNNTSSSGTSSFLSLFGVRFKSSNSNNSTRHLVRPSDPGNSSPGSSNKLNLGENSPAARYTKLPVGTNRNFNSHPHCDSSVESKTNISVPSTTAHSTCSSSSGNSSAKQSPSILKKFLKGKSKSDNNLHRIDPSVHTSSVLLNSVQVGDHASIRLPWTGERNDLNSSSPSRVHPHTHRNNLGKISPPGAKKTKESTRKRSRSLERAANFRVVLQSSTESSSGRSKGWNSHDLPLFLRTSGNSTGKSNSWTKNNSVLPVIAPSKGKKGKRSLPTSSSEGESSSCCSSSGDATLNSNNTNSNSNNNIVVPPSPPPRPLETLIPASDKRLGVGLEDKKVVGGCGNSFCVRNATLGCVVCWPNKSKSQGGTRGNCSSSSSSGVVTTNSDCSSSSCGSMSLEAVRNSGFINKPVKGWLHSDHELSHQGVVYVVRVRLISISVFIYSWSRHA